MADPIEESDPIETFVERLCIRLGVAYGGYHTLSPGRMDDEPCPEIAFHVGNKRHDRLQPATGEVFQGTGIVYKALVASARTVVRDENGKVIGSFTEFTKAQMFG